MSHVHLFTDRFRDQVILITGGAEGLGKAIARRVGKEGAQLALLDFDEAALARSVEELQKENITVMGIHADVSDEKSVKRGVSETVATYGKLDVAINSAGIVGATNTKITDFAFSDFERVVRVNLFGSFLLTKYAVEAMQPNGYGRILLIASIAGKEGNPGMVGYSASKSGVIGLVKGVAKEYATSGILVNGLAPAVIKTPMNADTAPEQLAYMTAKIPMARLGNVDEVASMAAFIVSRENSFSTGFIYDISGGRATY
jgi:NAD(P)-dependent dehydrogenase (short-subunit alcohol dehydrogenase family)